MLRSFKLGKLFGIPLYIHSTFVLLPLWLLLTNPGGGLGGAAFLMIWLCAVFACVVLHELGHALTARFFGIGTQSITLYPIGGVARLERMSEKPSEEVLIALAGPAVNLVIAALLTPAVLAATLAGNVLLTADVGLWATIGQFLTMVWVSNLFLLGFNLLPCFPMDGGRVLRALLAVKWGRLRATEIAARVGRVMAFLIACLSVPMMSPMPIVLAVFVFFVGQIELWGVRQLEARRRAAQMAQPILSPELAPIPLPPRDGGPSHPDVPFTGVAWDSRSQVWVRWHNGHPVAFWG